MVWTRLSLSRAHNLNLKYTRSVWWFFFNRRDLISSIILQRGKINSSMHYYVSLLRSKKIIFLWLNTCIAALGESCFYFPLFRYDLIKFSHYVSLQHSSHPLIFSRIAFIFALSLAFSISSSNLKFSWLDLLYFCCFREGEVI